MSCHFELDITDDGVITLTHRVTKEDTEYRKTVLGTLAPDSRDLLRVALAGGTDMTRTHAIVIGAAGAMEELASLLKFEVEIEPGPAVIVVSVWKDKTDDAPETVD